MKPTRKSSTRVRSTTEAPKALEEDIPEVDLMRPPLFPSAGHRKRPWIEENKETKNKEYTEDDAEDEENNANKKRKLRSHQAEASSAPRMTPAPSPRKGTGSLPPSTPVQQPRTQTPAATPATPRTAKEWGVDPAVAKKFQRYAHEPEP
jgi:hypothetical protein